MALVFKNPIRTDAASADRFESRVGSREGLIPIADAEGGNLVCYRWARANPTRWLSSSPSGSVVDEAQLVPELLLAAKKLVHDHPDPDRFLFTGSNRLRTDSLAGSVSRRGVAA